MLSEDNEMLREAVLQNLVRRFPVTMSAAGVRRAVLIELPFHVDLEAVLAALEYLRGLGAVEFALEELGPTKWWKATTKGVQHVERS